MQIYSIWTFLGSQPVCWHKWDWWNNLGGNAGWEMKKMWNLLLKDHLVNFGCRQKKSKGLLRNSEKGKLWFIQFPIVSYLVGKGLSVVISLVRPKINANWWFQIYNKLLRTSIMDICVRYIFLNVSFMLIFSWINTKLIWMC